ncbi:hypothetical protein AMS62_24310 [Bacillus sp. FJAT-18019]|nr:hypothetical protein AMS62_24310 [Bacillus sp. FJAT-18019]
MTLNHSNYRESQIITIFFLGCLSPPIDRLRTFPADRFVDMICEDKCNRKITNVSEIPLANDLLEQTLSSNEEDISLDMKKQGFFKNLSELRNDVKVIIFENIDPIKEVKDNMNNFHFSKVIGGGEICIIPVDNVSESVSSKPNILYDKDDKRAFEILF